MQADGGTGTAVAVAVGAITVAVGVTDGGCSVGVSDGVIVHVGVGGMGVSDGIGVRDGIGVNVGVGVCVSVDSGGGVLLAVGLAAGVDVWLMANGSNPRETAVPSSIPSPLVSGFKGFVR